MPIRIDFDGVFKDLFRRPPLLIVDRLARPGPIVEHLNVELQTVQQRRVDLALRLADQSILHIEFQSTNDGDMAERMLMYHVQLRHAYRHQRIRSLVLYVGPEPLTMPGILITGQLRFSFEVIDIRSFSADELLATGRAGDCVLALLARDGVARFEEIMHRIREMPYHQRELALAQASVLSHLRGLSSRVEKETKPPMPVIIELEETDPLFRRILDRYRAQGEAEGRARGEAEGRAEGEAEGRAQAARQLLRALLESRFGPLPKSVVSRIERASFHQAERLIVKTANAPSLDAVFGTKRR